MTYEVVFFTMTGNTKKVAEAIAAELNVSADDVKNKNELTEDSFVFLGSGCYGSQPGKGIIGFIDKQDFKGRKVALFGTSGYGHSGSLKALEKKLAAKGAEVIGIYHCKGKWLLANRHNPDDNDLQKAREFASKTKDT
jgi:flavodoxin I